MKIFKKKNVISSSLIVGSILGALTIFSCSTDKIDEENELSSLNQSLATPETGVIYTIENRNSGRIMEIANGSNSNGANLRQSGKDATSSETHRMWELFNTSDGFLRIRSVDSRKSLEVENGSNSNGANVEQRSFGGETHQEWELISTGEGYYRIRSRDSRKSISVDNGSRDNGANIEIDNWNGNDRFQWKFIEVSSNNNSGASNSDDNNNDNNNDNDNDNEVETQVTSGSGDFNLDPNAEPWENFDLSDWVIDTPAFASDGESERFGELNWGPLRRSDSDEFFFTHSDGGMRFVSTVGGARTSRNTSFVRSELREMLRAGNTSISTTGANRNNWALGYQPSNSSIGARNGRLAATLRVNKVTTTGRGTHPGRTIIGQIHASSDEPARLYYKKCPGADFGSIYLEHEIRNGDDVTFNLIGSERCSGNGPSNGIRLGELFSYEIINNDEDIIVNIRRGDQDGEIIATATVDMDREDSGYDRRSEWMYFKAGLYTQNNTGDDGDTDIATFYRLSNTHDRN